MVLSTDDAQLFYKLFLPLVDYVNRKYRISSKLKPLSGSGGLDIRIVKEVANKMWDDVSVIDEYLTAAADVIPQEHQDIIRGWKRRIRGKFVLERNLKNGSIFISMDDEQVYQVSGITSSWGEMFYNAPLPILMEATLIPFKDVIISDGLVMPYRVVIGSTMARGFKDIYMSAKKNGKLHIKL
jgi:hypothetical protein